MASVRDMANEMNLSTTLLKTVCSDEHLLQISQSIDDWRSFSPFLGLTPAQEAEIYFPPRPMDRQKIDWLRIWRRQEKQASYEKLAGAFLRLGRRDLAEELLELLVQSRSKRARLEEEKEGESQNYCRTQIKTYQSILGTACRVLLYQLSKAFCYYTYCIYVHEHCIIDTLSLNVYMYTV